MANIFLSYRREDSGGHTGRLHDYFAARWGSERVFWDIDAIEYGEDFVDVIDSTLAECAVVLAIIGPRWLTATDAIGRRRLDDSNDLHRLEIERALALGVRVIPTLVGGATMPREMDLPAALKSLARKNAADISDKRFRHDVERLIDAIERVLNSTSRRATPPINWPMQGTFFDAPRLETAPDQYDKNSEPFESADIDGSRRPRGMGGTAAVDESNVEQLSAKPVSDESPLPANTGHATWPVEMKLGLVFAGLILLLGAFALMASR